MALADVLVRRNALLGRYAFPQLRPMARMIAVGIYLLLVATTVVVTLAGLYAHGHLDVRAFWRGLFITFAAFQILLLTVVGAHLSGSAIHQEHAEKSIDFFRLLPLSASGRIVGILVGRNIVILGLAALNTLLAILCGAAGGVSLRLVLEFLIFAWVGGTAAMLFSLLISTHVPRRQTASHTFVTSLAAVFLLPYSIGIAVNWHETFPHGAQVDFFGLAIRLFVFLSGLALYAGVWFVLGLTRRFGNERAAFFSPTGAYANLIGAATILAGLIWHQAHKEPRVGLLQFWGCTAAVMLLTLFGSCRLWDDYLEARGRFGVGPGWRSANRSNLAHGAGMILLWGVLAMLAELRTGAVFPFATVATFMMFWCVFLVLWETSVTYTPWTARIHLLTGFLAIFYAILPLILGAILDAREITAFSPIGYTITLDDRACSPTRLPLLFGAGITALFLVAILRRYRTLTK